MKKIFKILSFAFIFFFFILIGNVEANTLNSVNMDIYIDEYGDAHVTEIWDYKVDSGTENYHSYKNIGNSKFTDFTVKDETRTYTTLSSWDVDASFSKKAYKCGINKISNGAELCWGISSYGRHTYTLNYTITNFVSELKDSQMVYWELIPKGNRKNAYIKIHSDFDYDSDTPVWGYGNYGGTCYVYDGYIEMQSDGKLDDDEYMVILVKFPSGTFNTSNVLNHDFEYYHEMAEKGATHHTNFNLLPFIFSFMTTVIFFIGFVFLFIYGISKNSSSSFVFNGGNRVSKDVPLFRDIPCKGDIFRAYFIAYNYKLMKKKTDFLGAILLKWLKQNKIQIEKKEVGKIFKKEDTCIILNASSTFDNSLEQDLHSMFYTASKDGILEEKEFEKWCSNNYSKILGWFDKVLNYERDELVKEGIITVQETTTLKIFKSKQYVINSSLMEEAKELKGLKKFLEEFTLIDKREAIEVALFEEYLIFAQILGIADKVSKQFKKLYPDIIENYNYDFDDVFLIYAISNSGISKANTAKSRAESYSSGGGGFSSGGGGRRLIWWRRPEWDHVKINLTIINKIAPGIPRIPHKY